MEGVLALAGFVALIVGLIVLIRGRIKLFRLSRRWQGAIVLVAGLALLLASGAMAEGGVDNRKAAEPLASTSPSPRTSPTTRAEPSPPPSPAKSPSPKDPLAQQSDAVGDVADDDGNKPREQKAGTDLVLVTLTGTKTDLVVRFESTTAFPTDSGRSSDGGAESIIWSAFAGGNYQVATKLVGTEWSVFVFDFGSTRQENLSRPPILSGNSLTAHFPWSRMPKLRRQFQWRAGSEWGGKWKDNVPDKGDDLLNPETVSFPR